MPRPINLNKFATKKELEQHKKEVKKLIKNSGQKTTKNLKKWDEKQDRKLLKKRK